MDEVKEAIGIDKANMDGKTIFIEEHHKANANFVLEAITSHCIKNNIITCFVLFHSTFGHLHNVGMKFGYNLRKQLNSTVKVIEPLKIVTRSIDEKTVDSEDKNFCKLDFESNGKALVKQLVQIIKDECIIIEKEEKLQKMYLIIDDLSHLFDLGLNIQDAWLFVRYIKSFVNIESHLTLCISSHLYNIASQELCSPNLLAIMLEHFAELVIRVQPLETGYFKSVSGKLIIYWKSHKERLKYKWPEEMIYLYKLFDRQVKLFTPGSSSIM